MKRERIVDPYPEETLEAPAETLVRWHVYNACGTLVATYDSEGAAQSHCASWASGAYYRGS